MTVTENQLKIIKHGNCAICNSQFNPRAINHISCSLECRNILNKNRQIKWVDGVKNTTRSKLTHKKCSRCKDILSINNFNKQNSKLDSYAPHCKKCIGVDKRNKYHNDPIFKIKSLDSRLKSFYGINIKEYDRMYNEQNGCCAICKRHQSDFSKRLAVDHEHETGKIRGLLCHLCNRALGNFGDSEDLLFAAIDYLKKNNQLIIKIIKGGL